MVSTDRFLLKKTAAKDAAGFTLIEITMALILLGILTAIAVPKYFDLQEEANATKCKYNRSVLQETVHTRLAVRVLSDGAGKVFTKDGVADEAEAACSDIQGTPVSKNTSKNTCQAVCPSGGEYSVSSKVEDNSAVVAVWCSKHGGENLNTVISADNARTLQEWLMEAYEKQITGEGRGSIADFFTDNPDAFIDSEAGDLDPAFKLMAGSVVKAILGDNIDTSNTIWQISRTGGCTVDYPRCGWTGKLVLRIAQKPSSYQETENVQMWTYTTQIAYNENVTDATGNSVGTLKSMTPLEAKEETGKIAVVPTNGTTYYALRVVD